MFGYVRPLKGDLLVREFTWYRAVYCGVCKSLGARYGQLPRLAVNYDITLLALLLFALRADPPAALPASCIANPLRKHPVAQADPVLDAAADVTVILAWHKARDDARDGRRWRGLAGRAVFAAARRRAAARWPEVDREIAAALDELKAVEAREPGPESPLQGADAFGRVTGAAFGGVSEALLPDLQPATRAALRWAGERLGRWIYLVDAVDDLADDVDHKNWNPFAAGTRTQAVAAAEPWLLELEAELDRTCALLPYERDAALVANIVRAGLPAVRADVLAGRGLARL